MVDRSTHYLPVGISHSMLRNLAGMLDVGVGRWALGVGRWTLDVVGLLFLPRTFDKGETAIPTAKILFNQKLCAWYLKAECVQRLLHERVLAHHALNAYTVSDPQSEGGFRLSFPPQIAVSVPLEDWTIGNDASFVVQAT